MNKHEEYVIDELFRSAMVLSDGLQTLTPLKIIESTGRDAASALAAHDAETCRVSRNCQGPV
jgi:hypothetical protein